MKRFYLVFRILFLCFLLIVSFELANSLFLDEFILGLPIHRNIEKARNNIDKLNSKISSKVNFIGFGFIYSYTFTGTNIRKNIPLFPLFRQFNPIVRLM
jgi:hypothetical protein